MTDVIYAETQHYDSGDGYSAIYYLVWTENGLGTYGVFLRSDGTPYGASRDYHRPAEPGEREARERYDAWLLDDDASDDDMPDPAHHVSHCDYLDCDAVCDGSSMVERTLDEQEGFHLAYIMAP